MNTRPTRKAGADVNIKETTKETLSNAEPLLTADKIPNGMLNNTERTLVKKASFTVLGKRAMTSSKTGSRVR